MARLPHLVLLVLVACGGAPPPDRPAAADPPPTPVVAVDAAPPAPLLTCAEHLTYECHGHTCGCRDERGLPDPEHAQWVEVSEAGEVEERVTMYIWSAVTEPVLEPEHEERLWRIKHDADVRAHGYRLEELIVRARGGEVIYELLYTSNGGLYSLRYHEDATFIDARESEWPMD